MSDNLSVENRTKNMRNIKSKNTKPELKVRKYLFSKGLRYKLHDKTLPGKPDLVFPKYKTVVFINGCFWHKHDCGKFHLPGTNTEYWETKIENNVQRDKKNTAVLKELGWNVLTVWECELKKGHESSTLNSLYLKITENNKKSI